VSARLVKRAMDLLVAVPLLVLLAIPMLIVAAAIRLTMGSPVLFRQVRPGRGKREFTLYKFRTMSDARGADGRLLSDDKRLVPLGCFLRRTSLDELPQLWNVLVGDMSLVGPRPLLCRYLPYYAERENLRFSVRPGITGWAQVHGRNHAPWDERLERDAWYAEHWSLGLDFRILLLSVVKVFRADGVAVDPGATMLDLDCERAGRA